MWLTYGSWNVLENAGLQGRRSVKWVCRVQSFTSWQPTATERDLLVDLSDPRQWNLNRLTRPASLFWPQRMQRRRWSEFRPWLGPPLCKTLTLNLSIDPFPTLSGYHVTCGLVTAKLTWVNSNLWPDETVLFSRQEGNDRNVISLCQYSLFVKNVCRWPVSLENKKKNEIGSFHDFRADDFLSFCRRTVVPFGHENATSPWWRALLHQNTNRVWASHYIT